MLVLEMEVIGVDHLVIEGKLIVDLEPVAVAAVTQLMVLMADLVLSSSLIQPDK
tara:strand:+ start:667 stop:828 length:162 start_codon:yes stop_codon:yes gene_type:complete